MGKVIMSGIVPQLEEPFLCDPVFANNDWSKIIEACQKNKVPDTWVVGSQKAMIINGTDYAIDIIGKNHDAYSDGSGVAPLTFQMHDCYGTKYRINSSETNSGGWTSCDMRASHLPDILALMPLEVQASIKSVSKQTSAGNRSTTISSTADKLFLLSEIEVHGTVSYSPSGEGTQYAYYAAGNSKIKNLNGSANEWWERSPNKNNSQYFCHVSADGVAITNYANRYYGVSFAFCF